MGKKDEEDELMKPARPNPWADEPHWVPLEDW